MLEKVEGSILSHNTSESLGFGFESWQQVLDSKLDCWQKSPLLYYVQWTGYEGTADKLDHTDELVQEFHKQYLKKPRPHYS